MATLLFLDDIGDLESSSVGEKAASLARLKRLGFPVPDGFVLREDAELEGPELAQALARLDGPVAVRSSSTAEDLAGASFAGQYATVLGVSGVSEVRRAVGACRASAAGALDYARTLGAASGHMAVLVQRMVEPRVAGVAFGRSPHDPGQALVEAVAGRGDLLLKGAATPDRYGLDRETGARVAGPEDGCLDAESLSAVARLVRRVEEALGSPQDVEWAIGPGRLPESLALLQARPITTEVLEKPDPRIGRLTRANIGEVLPGPVTPLTFTTVGAFLEHAFRSVLSRAGLLPVDAPPVVVLHRQRLYLNLSLAKDVAARLPGVSPADAERMILGGGAMAGAAPKAPSFSFAALGVGWRLLRLGHGKSAEIAAAERLVTALPSREVIRTASTEALAALLEAWVAVGRQVAATHVLTSGASAAALSVLARLLEAFARGPATERASRLTAGLSEVESAAPTLALEGLAEGLALDPTGLRWLQAEQPPGAFAPISGAPAELRVELERFLSRFGHRALSEGELASPAWEDDPTPVLLGSSRPRRSTRAGPIRGEGQGQSATRRRGVAPLPAIRPPSLHAVTGNGERAGGRARARAHEVAHGGRGLPWPTPGSRGGSAPPRQRPPEGGGRRLSSRVARAPARPASGAVAVARCSRAAPTPTPKRGRPRSAARGEPGRPGGARIHRAHSRGRRGEPAAGDRGERGRRPRARAARSRRDAAAHRPR